MENNPEISIILPCRNEEVGLPFCLQKIHETILKNNLSAEIIVSDSSTDKSPEIAFENNVILLKHDKEGYGVAYIEAFKIAKGKYIFMADADGTYDFAEIPNFIKQLKKGNELILGNRFAGKMEPEAMPFKNKYIGNPILSFILRLFFFAKIKDSHTGMRAIRKSSLELLNLKTTGMEFASEMIIKAIKNNLKIKEVPINYYKRLGQSKLKPFSDAWKHMRFMLLYSPLFLFFIPGIIFLFAGAITMIWLYFDSPTVLGVKLFYHPMFFSSALIIIGYQLIIFSAFAKSYAINHLGEKSVGMERLYKFITIERASIIGFLIMLIGALVYLFIFSKWVGGNFPAMNEIKNSIVGLTLIVLGTQTIFSSFMLSILSIKEK
jgi:glycosyltransferase involved in cell wall biosynthesis